MNQKTSEVSYVINTGGGDPLTIVVNKDTRSEATKSFAAYVAAKLAKKGN